MAHTHPLLEAIFPHRPRTVGDQIALLSEDVAALARQVQRYARPRVQDAAHAASDLAGDVLHQLQPMARAAIHSANNARRAVSHQVKATGRAVRDDPVPTVVALGTFALIASLLLRREE
jgi:ElaB/YqjD/DUF883 family membrane-anchored ribosome-binding protein